MVYISEILVNLWISLIFSQISPLYIVRSVKSLLFVIFVVVSSTLISVYKSVGAGFRRREGGIHICLVGNKLTHLLVTFVCILHCTFQFGIQFFDLRSVSLIWSFRNITFKSSIYLYKSFRFLECFWGFHPCILWNLRIC